MTNDRIKRLLLDEAGKRGFDIRQEDGDYIHTDCQTYLDGGHPDEPVTLSDDDRRLLLALQALV